MVLKLRRFRAKLKRQHKEFTPKVLCLRYHINSEFTETPSLEELTNEQNVGNGTTIKSTSTVEDTNEIQTEPLPLKGILKKANSYHGGQGTNYFRTGNLEEGKRSPLVFITHDHSDDYDEEESKNNNWQVTVDEKPLSVTYTTNDSPKNRKDLTNKTQIENCVNNNINFTCTDSQAELDDSACEDDDAYSSQAASIFFAGKPPKPLPRLRNNSTSSTT